MKLKLIFLTFSFLIYQNVHSAQQRRPDIEQGLSDTDAIVFRHYTNLFKKGVESKDASLVASAAFHLNHLFRQCKVGIEIKEFKHADREFAKRVNDKASVYIKSNNGKPLEFDYEIIHPKKNNKKKKKKLDENVQNELNNQLHLACSSGDLSKVKELLGLGANIEAKKVDGRTPLHTAVASCKLEVFKYLINQGANVNTETKLGITALHIVAQGVENENKKMENEEIAFILIHYISQSTLHKTTKKKGWNALHVAAAHGNLNVLKLLYRAGLNTNTLTKKIDNKQQFTAIELAQLYNQNLIVQFLQQNNK
jgi:hypothetical protein